MPLVPDECILEEVVQEHRIDAAMFVPLVIRRLANDSTATEATLSVSLRNVGIPGERQQSLRFRWSTDSFPRRPAGLDENTVTELAALGVACALLSVYTKLNILSVTGRGDRFDYWVGNQEREYSLEVSGTLTEDVESRHRAKVRQWHENPYQVDGYVIVIDFTTRNAIFSFQRFQEGPP